VQGAVVSFRAKSNPDVDYTGRTNKKGRYFVSGMYSGREDDFWLVEFEAEGYVPVEVRVESRTVNKILVGDPMTVKLGPGKKVPEFPIRPLGQAVLDWKVAPAEEVEAELLQAAEAAAQEAEEAAEPERDPWVEALTLASAGSLEESVELFREAVEQEPEDAERRETFAKILFRLEDYDETEVQARKAIEIEPSRVESHMMLYKAHDARGDLEQAKAALEAAREVAPDDTRVLLRLAYIEGQQGNSAAALDAYTRVTEIDPDNAEAWLSLANLHAEAGHLEESEKAYQRVVEIDPEGAHQTYYNLGATIIKRKNRSESDSRRAIEAFRKALELRPDYAMAAQELAFALIGIGDKQGAREVLEAFVEANPDSSATPRMKALLQTFGS
jgi:tetratricopeptide (TPR) repeat protein